MVDIDCIDSNSRYINVNTKLTLYGDDLIGRLGDGEETPNDWINLDAAMEFVALQHNSWNKD